MNTNRQGFRNMSPTEGTILARPVGVNLQEHATGPFCLVRGTPEEFPPCGVADAFGKMMIADHVLDLQVLNRNHAVLVDDSARDLVCKVHALISDLLMLPGQLLDGLSPITPAFLSSAHSTLSYSDISLGISKEPRIFNKLSVAGNSKVFNANIDANRRFPFGQRIDCNLAGEYGVPLGPFSLEGKRFYLSFERAVHLNFDNADALNLQPVVGRDVTPIAPCRKGEAVKAVSSLESGVAWFFTRFHAAEESLVSLVCAAKDILTARVICKFKVAVCSYVLELVRLVVVVKANAVRTVGIPSFLNRGVIKTTSLPKLLVNRLGLYTRGIKTIFERFTHVVSSLFDRQDAIEPFVSSDPTLSILPSVACKAGCGATSFGFPYGVDHDLFCSYAISQ